MYVNRLAKVASALELDSEEEGENNEKDRNAWREMQLKLIEEGKRPPLDDRYVSLRNNSCVPPSGVHQLTCLDLLRRLTGKFCMGINLISSCATLVIL